MRISKLDSLPALNRSRLYELLADLALLAAVWHVALLVWRSVPRARHALLDPSIQIIHPMIIIALATALWAQFRLSGKIGRLANPAWRRDLALTPIRPAAYLKSELAWLFVRLQAPALTTLPLLAFLCLRLFDLDDSQPKAALFWSVHNTAFALMILLLSPATNFLIFAGNLDHLIQLCEGRLNPVRLFFRDSGWLLFSLTPLIGGIMLFHNLMRVLAKLAGSPYYETLLKLGLLAIGAAFFSFIFGAGYLFHKKWQRAGQVYFNFEHDSA